MCCCAMIFCVCRLFVPTFVHVFLHRLYFKLSSSLSLWQLTAVTYMLLQRFVLFACVCEKVYSMEANFGCYKIISVWNKSHKLTIGTDTSGKTQHPKANRNEVKTVTLRNDWKRRVGTADKPTLCNDWCVWVGWATAIQGKCSFNR